MECGCAGGFEISCKALETAREARVGDEEGHSANRGGAGIFEKIARREPNAKWEASDQWKSGRRFGEIGKVDVFREPETRVELCESRWRKVPAGPFFQLDPVKSACSSTYEDASAKNPGRLRGRPLQSPLNAGPV